MKTQSIIDELKRKAPTEVEFHQAVEERQALLA